MQNNCYGSWSEFRQKATVFPTSVSVSLLFFGFLFGALYFSKIRATGNRESGRVPSSVSFSFQFPPNLPNWVKVLCHNQPGSRVRISNERATANGWLHKAKLFAAAAPWKSGSIWHGLYLPRSATSAPLFLASFSAGHIFIELLIGCHIISLVTTKSDTPKGRQCETETRKEVGARGENGH